MNKGAYILALGNPAYARWAVNLAASVRVYSPSLHITLLTNLEKIPDSEVYDKIVKVNDDHYTDKKGMFQPGKAKLYLNEYFEHDENYYIDADSILIAPIEGIKHNSVGLQVYNVASNESEWDCKWASWEQMKTIWKCTKPISEINSSFIYAKKSTKTDEFFKLAQTNFIENFESLWGKRFPDELAFNVASSKLGNKFKIENSGDHYPVLMTSKIGKENLGISKLREIAPILSYWGGKSISNIHHYRNYDLQARYVHRQIFGKENPYKYDDLVKEKLVVKDGIRLNVKPQIKKYE